MGFLDIIFFGAIAIFIFLRLRAVLGQRKGHEQDEPFSTFNMRRRQEKKPGAALPGDQDDEDNVVPLNGPRVRYRVPADEQINRATKAGSPEREGLTAILAADPGFEFEPFLDGAKSAYEFIVTAFARGAKDELKPLLSAEVYAGFEAAIDARADAGESQDVTVIGIQTPVVTEAGMDGSTASIAMLFKVEMITCTRNADGAVIDGHPNEVEQVNDVWTFERDTNSDDPNWTLVSTAG